MKTKFGIAASLVCLLLIPCFAFPETVTAADINTYHYVREGDVPAELGAADLLSRYLETAGLAPISDFERGYLASHASLNVRYSDGIASSSLRALVSQDGSELTVYASPYSFRTVGQITFTWTPETVNGYPMSEDGDEYFYKLNIADYAEDSVQVAFSAPVTIAKQDINAVLDLTHDAGEAARASVEQKRADYRSALADYEARRTAYETYQAKLAQYETDRDTYKAYLSASKEWSRRDAEYREFLAAKERYERDKAAYEAYVTERARYDARVSAYNDYLIEYEAYTNRLADYRAATASKDAQAELFQLAVMQYMVTPMTSLKRTLANAIMGDSVKQVLDAFEDAKGVTGLAGVDDEAVTYADKATLELRKLIPLYQNCKTDADRYVFYISYYDRLRDNFNELFRCLDYLYTLPFVQSSVESFDRTEQFQILLAQLYEICFALTDETQIADYTKFHHSYSKNGKYYKNDGSYTIGKNKGARRTPAQILGQDSLKDRNMAKPLDGGYISLPEEPDAPPPVSPPGSAPDRVNEPTPPTPADPPGSAPEPVAEPTLPDPADPPGDAPVEELPTAEEKAFLEAYDRGEVPASRSPLTENFTFKLTARVTKYFRNSRIIDSIKFYLGREDAKPVYEVHDVELGEYVRYEGRMPSKTRTGYDCVFVGWEDADGKPVDLMHIDTDKSDLSLYPRFSETPKMYTVAWVVGGKRFHSTCAYGTSPVYDESAFGEPSFSDGTIRRYRFLGWEGQGVFYESGDELPAMGEGNAVYTARFEQGYIISWSVGGAVTREPYWAGDMPVYSGPEPVKERDATSLYTFAGWSSGGKIYTEFPAVTEDASYIATFEATPILAAGSGGATVSEEGGYFVLGSLGGSSVLDMGTLFALAAEENMGIKLRMAGCDLAISARAAALAAERGAAAFSFSATQTSSDSYAYSLTLGLKEGARSALDLSDIPVTVTAPGNFSADHFLVETDEAGERDVSYSVVDGAIVFTAYAGRKYSVAPEYYVTILASEDVTLQADRMRARAGQQISIEAGQVREGRYLKAIFVRGADGTEYTLRGGSVAMPVGGITVGAVCERYSFTVVFCSEGKVLFTENYLYGDVVVAPAGTPVKASDDEFSYTFSGWDGEFGPVTQDMRFNALFEATPLPPVQPAPPSRISRLLHIAYVVVPVVLVVFIAGIVLLIVLLVRRHKKRKKAKNGAPMSRTKPPKTPPAPPKKRKDAPAVPQEAAVSEPQRTDTAVKPAPQAAPTPQNAVPAEVAAKNEAPMSEEGASSAPIAQDGMLAFRGQGKLDPPHRPILIPGAEPPSDDRS